MYARRRAPDSAHARGGPSTANNGCDLCQADNLLKETRGWSVTPIVAGEPAPGTGPTGSQAADRLVDGVRWRTPTGHSYTTRRARPGGVRGPARIVPRTSSLSSSLPHPLPRTSTLSHPPESVLEAYLAHLVGQLRQ